MSTSPAEEDLVAEKEKSNPYKIAQEQLARAAEVLGLDPSKDQDKAEAVAKRLVNGRNLYFGKARCSSCHVGDNFTHNWHDVKFR